MGSGRGTPLLKNIDDSEEFPSRIRYLFFYADLVNVLSVIILFDSTFTNWIITLSILCFISIITKHRFYIRNTNRTDWCGFICGYAFFIIIEIIVLSIALIIEVFPLYDIFNLIGYRLSISEFKNLRFYKLWY